MLNQEFYDEIKKIWDRLNEAESIITLMLDSTLRGKFKAFCATVDDVSLCFQRLS